MLRFEYKVVTIDDSGMYRVSFGNCNCRSDEDWQVLHDREHHTSDVWDSIDSLGTNGWELVSVSGWKDSEAKAVFKRSK